MIKKILNNDNDCWEDDYVDIPNYYPAHNISNSDTIEVTVIQDIYKSGENEEYILLKKNCKSKRIIYKEDIVGLNQLLTAKGSTYKKKVELVLRSQDPITIIGEYNNLKNTVFNHNKTNKIGFKFY